MPKSTSRRKSGSRKLNSYQRSVRAHKKEIAALAEKKGIKFMSAAAMVIKGRRSASKRRSGSKGRRSGSKRKSASKVSCPRGKVWRKAHKSASGKRVGGKCVKKGGKKSKSKSRRGKSKSKSRSM